MTSLPEFIKQKEASFDEHFAGYWRGFAVPDEIKFFLTQSIKEASILTLERAIELVERRKIGNTDTQQHDFVLGLLIEDLQKELSSIREV